MSTEQHKCPWPLCSRSVEHYFWGCPKHWNVLPQPLKTEFIVTQRREAEVQPVNHQIAIERINNWVRDNYVRLDSEHRAAMLTAPQYRVDNQRESTATREILETDFTAGWNARGEMILFWPSTGEYLILGHAEVKVVRRAACQPN